MRQMLQPLFAMLTSFVILFPSECFSSEGSESGVVVVAETSADEQDFRRLVEISSKCMNTNEWAPCASIMQTAALQSFDSVLDTIVEWDKTGELAKGIDASPTRDRNDRVLLERQYANGVANTMRLDPTMSKCMGGISLEYVGSVPDGDGRLLVTRLKVECHGIKTSTIDVFVATKEGGRWVLLLNQEADAWVQSIKAAG